MANGVALTVVYPDGKERTFPSIAQAAREIGVHRQEIHRYIRGEYKKCRKGFKFIDR